MSILIKGMEMPVGCMQFPFWTMYPTSKQLLDICLASGKKPIQYVEKELKPDWCPLIEVPQHGRLIIEDGEIVNE